MSKTYHCSQITKGKVDSAPALVSKDAICFYLVEPETGVVKERNHDAFGKSVVAKVLIMPSGKGIVVQEADTVLVAAAAAMEMPMVHRVDPAFFADVESGMNIALDADQGTITIL